MVNDFSLETAKKLATTEEPLVPNAGYITIGAMAGSILARNRELPSRLFFPVLTGVGSAAYFMPKTTWKLARNGLDAVVERKEQDRIERQVIDVYQQARQLPLQWKQDTMTTVSSQFRTAEDQVATTLRQLSKSILQGPATTSSVSSPSSPSKSKEDKSE